MALVICCVLLTLRIRRRMSMRAGIGPSLSRPLGLAGRLEDGARTRRARPSASPSSSPLMSFFSAIACEERRLAAVEPGEELLLVAPAVGDRDSASRKPFVAAKMMAICFSTGIGSYWSCFRISVIRWPRASSAWVDLSRSEANMAKAAISRYCARSRRRRPATAFIAFTCARAADARDRVADVDRGADAGVEEVGLEEDLAVGDRDDVRRDVGGEVARLGLDDRQRGERAPALLVVELGRALEQAAVQVEDVAGEGLAPRRAAQEQRDLAVGRRRAWRGRRRCRARACRCRGRTRPSRSRRRGRCTGGARGRRRWRRPRSCSPSPRTPRASAPPARPSTASGRWPRRCRRRPCPSG